MKEFLSAIANITLHATCVGACAIGLIASICDFISYMTEEKD